MADEWAAEQEDADVSDLAVDAKVLEYENFVEKVLKQKLKRSLEDFQKDFEVVEQVRELRQNIKLLLKDNITELETQVELGCQVYVKALVPDATKIFVDIGLGFHLEMPLEDADEFLEQKEEHLLKGLELKKQETARVKADIHEALHYIDLMMRVKGGAQPWLDKFEPELIQAFAGTS
eukprot:TRINITY_DN7728_c0_g1_i1.p1 TRINITY_DN7728_c0_g1~~TRINITY_DN7728_c0_g1_i1.p1  ORF type:complete len:189 (-),score=59.81 TRINITY_DN7728_c0_g1_i1:96-629(-)